MAALITKEYSAQFGYTELLCSVPVLKANNTCSDSLLLYYIKTYLFLI